MFTNNINSLGKKSQNILGTFTKMATDLQNVNAKIADEVKSREDQLKSLSGEIEQLNTISTQNAKVADKLATFLND